MALQTPNDGLSNAADQVAETAIRIVAKAMVREVPNVAREIAKEEIASSVKRTKGQEDHRADRRNRNRAYTLLVALVMTFLVPFLLANVLHAPAVLKYATGIAIVPDALITLWAYVRKY